MNRLKFDPKWLEDSEVVHSATLDDGTQVALPSYEWAILHRIVKCLPVRDHTPVAKEVIILLRKLGLVDAEKMVATDTGVAVDTKLQGQQEPPVIWWMGDEYRDLAEFHAACEHIFLVNWDAWRAMEAEAKQADNGAKHSC